MPQHSPFLPLAIILAIFLALATGPATLGAEDDPDPSLSSYDGLTMALPAIGSERYVVEEGDSLLGIALAHDVDLDWLAAVNNILDVHRLRVGQVLVIPMAERSSRSARGGERAPFIWPARGGISTYFGERGPYWMLGYHPGLDIAAKTGWPVLAAAAGVVVESEDGWNHGLGRYIKIDHGDGLQTLYAHLSRRAAGEGDRVDQGELIGYVGATGYVTGPHLHFEVRVDGERRDPLRYLP
ncbi:MAG: peptidoglycan DD-metalloendopeptidase family protein [Chloroflexi bacterium]|nr:peptidoglycan DD-metalloendopeptidase family protein [Chloroflexota bacterium]